MKNGGQYLSLGFLVMGYKAEDIRLEVSSPCVQERVGEMQNRREGIQISENEGT